MKKYMHLINVILCGLTLAGAVTIYFGLIGLFVVGCYQLLCSAYLAFRWRSLDHRMQGWLKIYFILLGIMAILTLVVSAGLAGMLEGAGFVLLMAASVAMGIFFSRILYYYHKGDTTSQRIAHEGVLDSDLID